MKKVFNIFVEGVADARIVTLKGWDNLKTETQRR